MAGNKTYRNLFINAVEDLNTSKKISYATIAKLSEIPEHKINNIRHLKSTPEIDIIRKLLRAFPYLKPHFKDIKDLKTYEDQEAYPTKQTIKVLQKEIELCTKKNNSHEATIEEQQKEIEHLKEIVAMQNLLLKDHGISGKS